MRAFRFRLPLVSPLRIGKQVMRHREGILLHSELGWTEASPLPGLSRETLDDVVMALRNRSYEDFPSLQFAIDSSKQVFQPARVPINALLAGTDAEILKKAKTLADSASMSVKLKVGRQDCIDEEIQLVQQVRGLLRADQRLRLDANRAWDFKSATKFWQHISPGDIEYIEEPLRDPQQLEELFESTRSPYALDESLTEDLNLANFPNATALVVKPTLVGGRNRIQELAKLGIPIVLSAAFESGIGIARIAQLAAEFSPGIAVGLDTYSWLADDVLTSRLEVENWELSVSTELEVDEQRLEERVL